MDNMVFYFLGTGIYWTTYQVFVVGNSKKSLRNLAVIALLALPLNVNGNVYTVIGNTIDDRGINNMYSAFSMIQTTENNTASLISLFQKSRKGSAFSAVGPLIQVAEKGAISVIPVTAYQGSNNGDAIGGMGVTLYQKSYSGSVLAVGVPLFQVSRNGPSGMLAGLSFMQKAENDTSGAIAGVSLVQKAKKEVVMGFGVTGLQLTDGPAYHVIGLSINQKSNRSRAGLGIGAVIFQHGQESARTVLGVAGIQSSGKLSETNAAIAVYQKVGQKNRIFAVLSKLKDEKARD